MGGTSGQRTRAVVFQPDAYLGLQKGINRIANVIRPTLGPRPRTVAIEQPLRHRAPEFLDDGATIAQRIVELPDRDEDMGAMFIRHVLMHVRDQAGDGTATAAVLLQSVYNEGVRYIAAGGNAMRLRHYLEKGTRAILSELAGATIYPQGEDQLAQIAEAICHDPPLARMMGEIFDIIGEYGRLEIRSGQGRSLEREYVEGMYWESGIISREMITDQARLRTELDDAAVLITDLQIEDPHQLVPALAIAKEAHLSSLLVVAQSLSDQAIALLLANSKPDEFQAAAVKAPGQGPTERGAFLQDLVMLVGGRPFLVSAGQETLNGIGLQDLGRARRAWADLHYFGIVGGKGDPRVLRRHITDLKAAYRRGEDIEARQKLQQRIGKLLAGSAILQVGGTTVTEILFRKEKAERTSGALRGAIIDGVLPGGGVAFLACCPALQRTLEESSDPDERAAYRALIKALEEPLRTIAANAGYDASQVMAQVAQAGPGYGFDVNSGQVVDVARAGILDVATAQKTAAQAAIAGAALALTTDVLVHHLKINWFKPGAKS
jgi:chaperonin GroEL